MTAERAAPGSGAPLRHKPGGDMNSFKQTMSRQHPSNARQPCTPRRRLAAALLAALLCGGAAQAGFVPVPDGDFSLPADAGTVGGGMIGASGTNVPIGAGLWKGTFFGALGLLAPPTLQIDSVTRSASVADVLGINALGIVDNGGHFSQTLAEPWLANKRYTLVMDVNSAVEMDLPLLAAAGVGSALRNGTTVLASSTTAAAAMLRSDKLDATTQRVALTYDSGPAAAGMMDIELFDEPQGLLNGELVEHAEFSDVKLARTTLVPGDSTLTVSGGGSQSALVGENYAQQLVATVRDHNGLAIPDALVTLAAPADGASAVLHAGGENGAIVMAFTDANGQVVLNATANPLAGCFRVTGSIAGVATTASFHMRNFTPRQLAEYLQAHPDAVEALQDSVYCNSFD
jgi:hypothetical protein